MGSGVQRARRAHGAVGLDLDANLVVIDLVAHAHIGNYEVGVPDRGKHRIQSHGADRQLADLLSQDRNVAQAFFNGYFNIELSVLGGKSCDMEVWVCDFDVGIALDVAGGRSLLALDLQGKGLWLVGVEYESNLLEVQAYLNDILDNA